MTVTTSTLTRASGAAAMAAGALFIGVQLGHPHLDATSVTTTQVVVRGVLKVVMAALALAGITGMYVSQVRRNGVLGLVGYLVLSVGYLLVTCTAYVSAFVLPSIAATDRTYVDDVIAVATGGSATGDIGLLGPAVQVQGLAWLVGGLLFGVALFRARVLSRWACASLAVGGVVTALLSVMPDAFYRLLAFPNGIAMIALGWSLWRSSGAVPTTRDGARPVARAGYEILVEGHLDEHWGDWVGGVTAVRNDDGTTTFRLTGDDQAALHGVLARLRDIGVTLVAVQPTGEPSTVLS